MKYKHLDIKFLSDDGVPVQEDAQVAIYFDDLPPLAQEAIIDLIASIIETKKNQKRGAHE